MEDNQWQVIAFIVENKQQDEAETKLLKQSKLLFQMKSKKLGLHFFLGCSSWWNSSSKTIGRTDTEEV